MRGLFCTFRHIHEDMLVAKNTDLNHRSTTSLVGTQNFSSEVPFPIIRALLR